MSLYISDSARDFVLPIFCGFGLIGNLASFGIFSRKKFDSYYLKNSFRLNLLVDSLNLTFILIKLNYLNYIPNSIYFCKFFYTIIFVLPAYSAWILVYISVERFLRTIYKGWIIKILDKKLSNQIILMSILLICFFFYTPVWYFTSVIYILTSNDGQYAFYYTYRNETVIQCYLTEKIVSIVTYMNMLFSCLIPFVCLIVCSILLIYSIRIIRSKINRSNQQLSEANLITLKKDNQFAITILALDCIFLLFYFPYNILAIFQSFFVSDDFNLIEIVYFAKYVLEYVYYFGFASNFIVFISVNKMFREEFIVVLKSIDRHFSVARFNDIQ
jgi:hypothetical protein